MLKIFLLAVVIIGFALIGLAIRMIIDKKAEFRARSCASTGKELGDMSATGCCGGVCMTGNEEIKNN